MSNDEEIDPEGASVFGRIDFLVVPSTPRAKPHQDAAGRWELLERCLLAMQVNAVRFSELH